MTREEVDRALSAVIIPVNVVADVLAVSNIQVYKLIYSGKLEAVNVGAGKQKAYRVKSDSVRRILEGVS